MLQPQSLNSAIFGLLLVATLPVAAQSNSLDSVPQATQEEISRVCLPVQFREGAGAYRNCVQSELALRASGRTTDLGQLSFDDKYAVQQACAKAGGQSSENYQSCVTKQINELNQVTAPSLEQLSEDELYVVQQSCFNAQSKLGAASYRQCLNDELQSLLSVPAADTSNLNMLKKNALQLRCSSNSTNVVQYRQCIAEQYESIAGTEPEFLPTGTSSAASTAVADKATEETSSDNQTAAASDNAATDSIDTNAEQNINQASTEQSIDTTEVADEVAVLSSESLDAEPTLSLPRNITPPTSSNTSNELTTELPSEQSDAKQATLLANQSVETNVLNDETNVIAQSETTNLTADINTQSNVATAEARVISRPGLVEAIEDRTQTNTQQVESDTNLDSQSPTPAAVLPQNASPLQKIGELWNKPLDKLSSMDAIGWLLIAGVLALPALLLGFFSMVRSLKKTKPVTPEYAHAHQHQHQMTPGIDTRRQRHEDDAADFFVDDNVDTNGVDHDAVTRIATKSEQQRASRNRQESANTSAARFGDTHNPAGSQSRRNKDGWQSAFGSWLMQQPEADRLGACIEFLIYWVAYGDNRYQPDLKQRLFTDSNLSSQDQIKRWVLKQDVFAFADVVGWLRTKATQKQLDQCVALIMALLVTEHSLTPVQNTMLRFLSDAFDIGKNQIEQRFSKAFGHTMPPVPRTDKYAWWTKQRPEYMQRWEARFMATKSEHEQMIARLGLTSDYDDAQVINAFRRSARRCHPDRFTELGDRERALAEQQFVKFEQARDKLLGVSV